MLDGDDLATFLVHDHISNLKSMFQGIYIGTNTLSLSLILSVSLVFIPVLEHIILLW